MDQQRSVRNKEVRENYPLFIIRLIKKHMTHHWSRHSTLDFMRVNEFSSTFLINILIMVQVLINIYIVLQSLCNLSLSKYIPLFRLPSNLEYQQWHFDFLHPKSKKYPRNHADKNIHYNYWEICIWFEKCSQADRSRVNN